MVSMEIRSKSSKVEQHEFSWDSITLGIIFDSLSWINLNVSSLDNKLDEFKVVIEQNSPILVGKSETWFKETSITNLDGYWFYRKDRSDRRRVGGVCLYIDKEINSVELNDQRLSFSKLEQICVILYFGKTKY